MCLSPIQGVLDVVASILGVKLWVEDSDRTTTLAREECPLGLRLSSPVNTETIVTCLCGCDALVVPVVVSDDSCVIIRSGHLPKGFPWVDGHMGIPNLWDEKPDTPVRALSVTAAFIGAVVRIAHEQGTLGEIGYENIRRIGASLARSLQAPTGTPVNCDVQQIAQSFHRVPSLSDFIDRISKSPFPHRRTLTDVFHDITEGLPASIGLLTLGGVSLFRTCRCSTVCRLIREKRPLPCVLSDLVHMWRAVLWDGSTPKPMDLYSYQCPYGITENVRPIMADGLGVGAVIAGQMIESTRQRSKVRRAFLDAGLREQQLNACDFDAGCEATEDASLLERVKASCHGLADLISCMYREWCKAEVNARLRAGLIEAAFETNADEFCAKACPIIAQYTGVRRASIWLQAQGRLFLAASTAKEMYVRDSRHSEPQRVSTSELIRGAFCEIGEGLTGRVAKEGNKIIPDTAEDEEWWDRYGELPDDSQFIGIRLKRDEDLCGVLRIYQSCGDVHLSGDDLTLLENLGDELAITIHEKLLAAEAAQKAEEFRLALMETGHEFRSPLQAILSQLAVLKASLGDNPQFLCTHKKIEEEVFRARRQMDAALAFGRELGFNFIASRLGPILQAVADAYITRAADRNIRIIVWDSAKRLPKIRMDSDRIRQVVTNLIDNAVKWSFAGECIHIRGQALLEGVVFTVEDRGTGIPEDREQAIFEKPFLRKVIEDKKRLIAGTGIGLKIAKKIVDAHHGTISVSSVPFLSDPRRQGPEYGHVVIFTVRLPSGLSQDEKATHSDHNKEKE